MITASTNVDDDAEQDAVTPQAFSSTLIRFHISPNYYMLRRVAELGAPVTPPQPVAADSTDSSGASGAVADDTANASSPSGSPAASVGAGAGAGAGVGAGAGAGDSGQGDTSSMPKSVQVFLEMNKP